MSTGKIELSVGAVKIANKYELFTEEEIDSINKISDIEDELEESVKFKVVGEGTTVPPISGGGSYTYDDTEIREMINETNASLDKKANLQRLNDVYINVKDFTCDDGEKVKGDGKHNDTTGIQKAMDYVSSLKCGTLLFPNGVYLIDKLELKPYVSIKGHGMNSTVIKANTSNNNGLFILKSTPLQMVQYEDFSIIGNKTNNQHGVLIESYSNGVTGGLWLSTFRRLKIEGFKYNQFYITYNFDNNFNCANQSLIFEQCHFSANNTKDSKALEVKGTSGQLMFINSHFNGAGSSVTDSISVALSKPTSDNFSLGTNFIGCTFTNAHYGVIATRSASISYMNCWFENIQRSISHNLTSYCNRVIGTTFLNAGGGLNYGTSEGYLVKSDNGSILVDGCYSMGHCDKGVVGNIRLSNCQGSGFNTSNTVRQTTIQTDGTIELDYRNKLLINASSTTLSNIIDNIGYGYNDQLIITFNGNCKVDSNGNIKINGETSFKQNDNIVLVKDDLLNKWVIISKNIW